MVKLVVNLVATSTSDEDLFVAVDKVAEIASEVSHGPGETVVDVDLRDVDVHSRLAKANVGATQAGRKCGRRDQDVHLVTDLCENDIATRSGLCKHDLLEIREPVVSDEVDRGRLRTVSRATANARERTSVVMSKTQRDARDYCNRAEARALFAQLADVALHGLLVADAVHGPR